MVDVPAEHDPSEISYDEQRYPARPRRLRPRDRMRAGSLRRLASDPRTANGTNPANVEWLVRQSMLKDADDNIARAALPSRRLIENSPRLIDETAARRILDAAYSLATTR